MTDCFKDNVTPLNNPECEDCNECCSMDVLLTDEEFEKLQRFVKKNKHGKYLYSSGIEIILNHIKHNTVYWMCPFSRNKRCTIYNKRPVICQHFHCDSSALENTKFKKSYTGNHSMLDLFRKDTFDKFGITKDEKDIK